MVSKGNVAIGRRALLLLLAVVAALLAASGAALALSKVCPSGTTQANPCLGTNASDKLTGTSGTDYINGLYGNDVELGLLGNDFLRGQWGATCWWAAPSNSGRPTSTRCTAAGTRTSTSGPRATGTTISSAGRGAMPRSSA